MFNALINNPEIWFNHIVITYYYYPYLIYFVKYFFIPFIVNYFHT